MTSRHCDRGGAETRNAPRRAATCKIQTRRQIHSSDQTLARARSQLLLSNVKRFDKAARDRQTHRTAPPGPTRCPATRLPCRSSGVGHSRRPPADAAVAAVRRGPRPPRRSRPANRGSPPERNVTRQPSRPRLRPIRECQVTLTSPVDPGDVRAAPLRPQRSRSQRARRRAGLAAGATGAAHCARRTRENPTPVCVRPDLTSNAPRGAAPRPARRSTPRSGRGKPRPPQRWSGTCCVDGAVACGLGSAGWTARCATPQGCAPVGRSPAGAAAPDHRAPAPPAAGSPAGSHHCSRRAGTAGSPVARHRASNRP